MQIRFIRMIDDLFRNVPHSRKVLELKEEMVQNLMDKYNDLIGEGKSEEAAFGIAAASIGDISDLVHELRKDDPFYAEDEDGTVIIHDIPVPRYVDMPLSPEETRQHAARISATSVMLFILSPVPLLLLRSREVGVLLLLAMIAAGVGLLVFSKKLHGSVERDSGEPLPRAETIQPDEKRKNIYKSIESAFWLVVTALYILISFETGTWHVSWVIFLFATAVERVMAIFFKPNPEKLGKRLTGAMVTCSIAFFFLISFRTGAWHISWVIILIFIALSNVLKAFLDVKRKEGM